MHWAAADQGHPAPLRLLKRTVLKGGVLLGMVEGSHSAVFLSGVPDATRHVSGATPLLFAAVAGSPAALRTLLEGGARPSRVLAVSHAGRHLCTTAPVEEVQASCSCRGGSSSSSGSISAGGYEKLALLFTHGARPAMPPGCGAPHPASFLHKLSSSSSSSSSGRCQLI